MQQHIPTTFERLARISAAVLLLCLSLPLWAAKQDLRLVQIDVSATQSRLVFESAKPIRYEILELDNPDRLVVDFKLPAITPSIRAMHEQLHADDPFIRAIRYAIYLPGTIRVVFDLKTPAHAQAVLAQLKSGEQLLIKITPKRSVAATESAPALTPSFTAPAPQAEQLVSVKEGDTVATTISPRTAIHTSSSEDPALKLDQMRLRKLSLPALIQELKGSNAVINAKRLDIDSAQANVETMSMPYISPSFGYSKGSYYKAVPYNPMISPQSDSYSFSGTIEGPGKRSSREAFSLAEVSRQKQEYQSIERNLEFDAAAAFVDALRTKRIWQIYASSINALSALNLPKANDIIADDRNNQQTVARDFNYQALGLLNFLGNIDEVLIEPTGSLAVKEREFRLSEILASAPRNRLDMQALEAARESAVRNLTMVDKNRNADIGVGLSISNTPGYVSSGTAYNKTSAMGFSLSVPIAIQLISRADLTQASNTLTQVELSIRDLRTRIHTEIQQNHLRYMTAKEQLASAAKDHAAASAKRDAKSIESLTDWRDKEIALVDAQTVHIKALLGLLKASGMYEVPAI